MARKSKNASVQNMVKKAVKRQVRRRGGLGAIIIVLILALIGFFNPALRDKIAQQVKISGASTTLSSKDNEPLPSNKQSPLKEGTWPVVHCVDGDTIDVLDDQGTKHRIRFIGSDTPETVKPGLKEPEPFGPEASAFTKRMIAESNNRVRVAFDGDQIDRYGRNLAMIYVQTSQGEVWLNELLVRQGLARTRLQYRFSKGAKERLRIAEEQAQTERLNIWSMPW